MKFRLFIFVAAVALVLMFGVLIEDLVFPADQVPVVELSKAEALELMNKRFSAVAAEADWRETLTRIMDKYHVSLETHELDLTKGVFVAKPQPKEPNQ